MVHRMSETSHTPEAPVEWLESLQRSKAQISAGETVPLLPILDRLRVAAERLEEEMGIEPEESKPSLPR